MAVARYKGKVCEKHPSSLRYESSGNCIACVNSYNPKNTIRHKKWLDANKDEVNRYRRERYRNNLHVRERYANEKALLKLAVINVLTNGEGTCRHCGQGDIDVLCVDHINNNGSEHRKSIGQSATYRWLVKHDYPEGFQVLCYNCNMKKEVERKRSLRTVNG